MPNCYRLATRHERPVGDGADWLHDPQGRWWRAETPDAYATLAEADAERLVRGLHETGVDVVYWPQETDNA